MEDTDLEEIRAQRLRQLQSQYGGPAGQGDANQQKAAEERKREVDDMKNSILSQVLDQPARARLNTLMLGKPEKGRMVENMLLQMAQTGQLRQKLGEDELIGLLERVGSQKSTSVKFDRRRAALDSDEDDLIIGSKDNGVVELAIIEEVNASCSPRAIRETTPDTNVIERGDINERQDYGLLCDAVTTSAGRGNGEAELQDSLENLATCADGAEFDSSLSAESHTQQWSQSSCEQETSLPQQSVMLTDNSHCASDDSQKTTDQTFHFEECPPKPASADTILGLAIAPPLPEVHSSICQEGNSYPPTTDSECKEVFEVPLCLFINNVSIRNEPNSSSFIPFFDEDTKSDVCSSGDSVYDLGGLIRESMLVADEIDDRNEGLTITDYGSVPKNYEVNSSSFVQLDLSELDLCSPENFSTVENHELNCSISSCERLELELPENVCYLQSVDKSEDSTVSKDINDNEACGRECPAGKSARDSKCGKKKVKIASKKTFKRNPYVSQAMLAFRHDNDLQKKNASENYKGTERSLCSSQENRITVQTEIPNKCVGEAKRNCGYVENVPTTENICLNVVHCEESPFAGENPPERVEVSSSLDSESNALKEVFALSGESPDKSISPPETNSVSIDTQTSLSEKPNESLVSSESISDSVDARGMPDVLLKPIQTPHQEQNQEKSGRKPKDELPNLFQALNLYVRSVIPHNTSESNSTSDRDVRTSEGWKKILEQVKLKQIKK